MVAGQNEHDPPRSRDRRNLERQHSRGTALQGAGRDLENVRLHRCQSTVSAKAWSTGFDPTNAEFPRFDCASRGEERRLRLPPSRDKLTEQRGKAAVTLPHGVLVPRAPRGPHIDSEHSGRQYTYHPSDLPTGSFGPMVPGRAARYVHSLNRLSGHVRSLAAILKWRRSCAATQPVARVEWASPRSVDGVSGVQEAFGRACRRAPIRQAPSDHREIRTGRRGRGRLRRRYLPARQSYAGHAKEPITTLQAPPKFVKIVKKNLLQAGMAGPAQAPPGAGTAAS